MLVPIMPDTNKEIAKHNGLDTVRNNSCFEDLMNFYELPTKFTIDLGSPLFPNIEEDQQNSILNRVAERISDETT